MIVNIALGFPEQDSDFTLRYKVHDTELGKKWTDRLVAGMQYPIDHPDRFYGWVSKRSELAHSVKKLLDAVETVNTHQRIIPLPSDATDQDWLNTVHTIFEEQHGTLDNQTSEFFVTAPLHVQQALANINVYVHAVETAKSESQNPRFVVTRWGLPKTHLLTDRMLKEHGTMTPPWGSLCLSYCEIGKTLEDLALDKEYPSDMGFKPWQHYSADFVARFYEETDVVKKCNTMRTYFEWNRDWFEARGYNEFEHPRILPLRFPVAQLIEEQDRDEIIYQISRRQRIKQVYLTDA